MDRCKEEGIDGVLNVYIDPCQMSYHKICTRLGLPCFATAEQYNIFSDKKLFLKTCIENWRNIRNNYCEVAMLCDNVSEAKIMINRVYEKIQIKDELGEDMKIVFFDVERLDK